MFLLAVYYFKFADTDSDDESDSGSENESVEKESPNLRVSDDSAVTSSNATSAESQLYE